MAGLSAISGGGWDYIQAAEPADPETAELWFDTDAGPDGQGEAKVYDGNEWQATGYISHDQLTNVSPADHHDPVTVSAPLTRSGQALALALGNALTLDSNDDLAVAEGNISLSNLSGYPVGTGDLGFKTATQSELDAVDNSLSSHESDTTNPHNVTDDQTGAAAALSNHESDTTAHHSKPASTQTSGGSANWAPLTNGSSVSPKSTVSLDVPATKFRIIGQNSSLIDIFRTSSKNEKLLNKITPKGSWSFDFMAEGDAGGGHVPTASLYPDYDSNDAIVVDKIIPLGPVPQHSHQI